MQSLVSTHTVLGVHGGEFVSLLETPDEFQSAARTCQNIGAWPVLVGEMNERNLMLSSPIILYDYPKIAPESAGDLFDGTEIDEILGLRILTLTEEEKREMRCLDERTRKILERIEALPRKQWKEMHGTLRDPRPVEEESQ
jgi:hydrogenase maturation protease